MARLLEPSFSGRIQGLVAAKVLKLASLKNYCKGLNRIQQAHKPGETIELKYMGLFSN